jgi:uncharacterized phage protein (TIGR02220 family)
MEIIKFITDLRKKNIQYYNVWMPIIMQFDTDEYKRIKLSVPLNINKNTYYRAISYGLEVFPNYLKNYTLVKNRQEIILSMLKQEVKDIPEKIIVDNEVLTEDKKEEEKQQQKVEPRKKSTKDTYPNEVYDEIINFLNASSGKQYRVNTTSSRKIITSRLNDGFTIDDFKQVISIKCTKWLNTDMEQFLRPETLFSNKFESYLNETLTTPKTNIQSAYEQVSYAAQLRDSQG